MLTPLDIQKKEFSSAFRGYKAEEVDAFLDLIIQDYEALYRENLDTKKQLTQMERDMARYREIEEVLQKTLVMAQKSADELRKNSEKEAQLLLERAGIEAERLSRAAEREAAEAVAAAENKATAIIVASEENVSQAIEEKCRFEKQTQVFRAQFRALIDAQLRLLEEDGFERKQGRDDLKDPAGADREEKEPATTGAANLAGKPAGKPDAGGRDDQQDTMINILSTKQDKNSL